MGVDRELQVVLGEEGQRVDRDPGIPRLKPRLGAARRVLKDAVTGEIDLVSAISMRLSRLQCRILTSMPLVLFVLITWTTYRRMPMIGEAAARFLERFLPAEAQRQGATVIRLGMVCDHVHAVLRLPGRIDLPRLMQGFKGASARLANQDSEISRTGLRWAAGYSAYSVSPRNLKAVVDYVKQQAERHPDRAIHS